MKRKIMMMLLAVIFCFVGCGSSEQTDEEIAAQFKEMATGIQFEESYEESMDSSMESVFDEDAQHEFVYTYQAILKNPTNTDFEEVLIYVTYIDEAGNNGEESFQDREWNAGKEGNFVSLTEFEEKISDFEINKIQWLKAGTENWCEVVLNSAE